MALPKRLAHKLSFGAESSSHTRQFLAREIVVLVENLTEHEFQIRGRVVEEGNPKVELPRTIGRAAKLRWRAYEGCIMVAAEYESCSPAPAAVTEEEEEESEDASTSRTGSSRSLLLAAVLPSTEWNPASWLQGSNKPRFAATLRPCKGPADRNTLSRFLASAAPVGRSVESASTEWLPVRVEADALEVRVRLLPTTTLLPSNPSGGAARGEEEPMRRDEAELRRLSGYCNIVEALNMQAAQLELQADGEPMNLSRLRELPEKARVDLLLLVLGSLLKQGQSALERLQDSDEDVSGTSSGPKDLFDRALTVRETVNRKLNLDTDDEEQQKLQKALAEHTETVHHALVPLLGFDSAGKRHKIAALVETYTRSEPGCTPELPDLPALAASVREALEGTAQGGKTDEASTDGAAAWSAEHRWALGTEDTAARFLRKAMVIDMDLAPSVEAAVKKLNQDSRICPEECCITRVSHLPAFAVLYRDGRREQALAQLGVHSEADLAQGAQPAPPPQTVDDFVSGPALPRSVAPDLPLPRTWLMARDLVAVLLGAGGGSYDSRTRAALLDIFCLMGVPPRLVARWESEIGGALFEVLEASSIVARENNSQKGWKRGKVALAAAGGGILLAVTSGLAAPAVAAGVTAMGTTAVSAGAALGLAQAGAVLGAAIAGWGAALASLGPAGAAVLFGATGAGITSWKLSRRWGDLEEFSFIPLMRSTRWIHTTVEVSDTAAINDIERVLKAGAGTMVEDAVVPTAAGGTVVLARGYALVRSCPVAFESGKINPGLTTIVTGKRYYFQREVDRAQRAVHLALFVSGWLQDEQDFTRPWAEPAKLFFPSSGHLALRWEARQLLELGTVFSKMVAQEVASSTASFWFRTTAAATATAGSIAALAVSWPIWIIASMAQLDNTWLVCIERARLAGRCLAHALADRQTVGQRPVTLVGHSIGARLLVYCLLELHKMGEFHAVHDVVLLGTPVTTSPSKWNKVRAVASGRVVNGYLGSDWVLAFLYRYLEWGLSVAGLSEVRVPGIENVNLSGLGIAGHHDYPRHVPNIMARMRIGEHSTPAS